MEGQRFAVLIGSSQYPKDPKRLQALRCPVMDVDGLRDILASQEYGHFSDIAVLKNVPHYESTRKILQVLKSARKDDLVLLYYSGHGKLDPAGSLYLATADTQLDDLEATSIPIESIRRFIYLSASRKVILILDCCYGGRVGNAFLKSGVDDQLQQIQSGRGIYILTASTGIQVAQEKEGDQYSLLTKHILEGIKNGEADIDDKGFISIDDLYRYAASRMRHEDFQEPMKWDLNVQGEELVIARSGKALVEKQRKRTKQMLYDLWVNGILPYKILTRAAELIESEKTQATEAEERHRALIQQLLQKKITIGDFILEWQSHEIEQRSRGHQNIAEEEVPLLELGVGNRAEVEHDRVTRGNQENRRSEDLTLETARVPDPNVLPSRVEESTKEEKTTSRAEVLVDEEKERTERPQQYTKINAPQKENFLSTLESLARKLPMGLIGLLVGILTLALIAFWIAYRPKSTTQSSTNKNGITSSPTNPTAASNKFGFRQTLNEQRGKVWAVAFSSDGSTLASVGEDKTLRVWDASLWKLKFPEKNAHTKPINTVAFSPDGRVIATGSSDTTVALWNAVDGTALEPLTGKGHTDKVLSVTFSHDGRFLASAGADGMIKLWNIEKRSLYITFQVETSKVWALAFSPDGSTLAGAIWTETGHEQGVRLWDLGANKELKPLGWNQVIYSLAFSPDGETLATGDAQGVVALWRWRLDQLLHRLSAHEGWVKTIVFSRDGSVLASAAKDNSIKLWNFNRVKENSAQASDQILTGHQESVEALCFSPDGKTLVSGSQDQTIRIWQRN